MTNDNDTARLSEQEVAAFAITLTKMVRGFGSFMLLSVAAMGGIAAIPYFNPPDQHAVLETISKQRTAVESVVRPDKWSGTDDAAKMSEFRSEMQAREGKIWQAITKLKSENKEERYKLQTRVQHCEWELEQIEKTDSRRRDARPLE